MIRYLTLFIAVLLSASAATAQWYSGLGVRLSMDVSVPSGARDYYGTGAGFSVGAVYQVPLTKKLSLEPGLMFSYSTMSTKDDFLIGDYYYQGAARISSLSIPLLLSYNIPLYRNVDMNIGTGPIVQFNTSARQNILPNMAAPDPVPAQRINLFRHGFKRVQALWGIRLSFTFAKSYVVGINTSVAFTPLAKFGMKDKRIKLHSNTIAISLGYNF